MPSWQLTVSRGERNVNSQDLVITFGDELNVGSWGSPLEKSWEIKRCFPGEIIPQLGLEEEKVAQPWKREESAFQTGEGGGACTGPEGEGRSAPGRNAEGVQRGVGSGAGSRR